MLSTVHQAADFPKVSSMNVKLETSTGETCALTNGNFEVFDVSVWNDNYSCK